MNELCFATIDEAAIFTFAQHHRLLDLAVLRLLVVAAQQIGNRPDEGREAHRLIVAIQR